VSHSSWHRGPRPAAAQPAAQANFSSGPVDGLLEILEMVDETAQPALPPLRMPRRPAAPSLPPAPKVRKRRNVAASQALSNAAGVAGLLLLMVLTLGLTAVAVMYGVRMALGGLLAALFLCRIVCFIATLGLMVRNGAVLYALAVIVVPPILWMACVFVGVLFGVRPFMMGVVTAYAAIFLGDLIALSFATGNADDWRLGSLPAAWGGAWLLFLCVGGGLLIYDYTERNSKDPAGQDIAQPWINATPSAPSASDGNEHNATTKARQIELSDQETKAVWRLKVLLEGVKDVDSARGASPQYAKDFGQFLKLREEKESLGTQPWTKSEEEKLDKDWRRERGFLLQARAEVNRISRIPGATEALEADRVAQGGKHIASFWRPSDSGDASRGQYASRTQPSNGVRSDDWDTIVDLRKQLADNQERLLGIVREVKDTATAENAALKYATILEDCTF
jgi:hypothetical protein